MIPHMHFQRIALSEPFVAQLTLVRPFFRMNSFVFDKVNFLSEGFATCGTSMRFLAGVQSHMKRQRVGGAEGFTTNDANALSDLVASLMQRQTARVVVNFATFRARKRGFRVMLVVYFDMPIVPGFREEFFAANDANVAFAYRGMIDFVVRFVRGVRREAFAAFVALDRELFVVIALVEVKQLFRFVLFAALVAFAFLVRDYVDLFVLVQAARFVHFAADRTGNYVLAAVVIFVSEIVFLVFEHFVARNTQ